MNVMNVMNHAVKFNPLAAVNNRQPSARGVL